MKGMRWLAMMMIFGLATGCGDDDGGTHHDAGPGQDGTVPAAQVRPEPMPLTELIREVLKDLVRG